LEKLNVKFLFHIFMAMKNLPIGIQDLPKLRQRNGVYVDKTELVYRLVTRGTAYFMSRPRRFGKSLLVSTLKELFQGNRQVFKGLWIAEHWDWETVYPVLHFSFDGVDYEQAGLEQALMKALDEQAAQFELKLKADNYKTRFIELIKALHKKHGPVILLVDEYDKPITDYLTNLPLAEHNRDVLREFYSVVKPLDAYLHFVFITGVSKFSKVSIFSHLNSLDDITLDRHYAALMGYTQEELVDYFSDYLDAAQRVIGIPQERLLSELQNWYNGYSWDGETKVYNPFGILNFLHKQQFVNFWFATGSPKFLVEQMRREGVFEVEEVEVNNLVFERFDLDNISPIPLLFQTGYLTVKSFDALTGEYVLDYPNKEVRESMYQFLLSEFSESNGHRYTGRTVRDLQQAFSNGDIEQVRLILDSILADLPYHTFDKQSEGLYHGLIHIVFNYLGVYMSSEVHSARGRADAIVQTDHTVYIFEFKLKKEANAKPASQIQEKGYTDRFQSSGKRILGIGVTFDPQTRSIKEWEVVELQ
jgi:hypothetical protein